MALAYRGRFAPSPTGPLHAGSLVAALASWLDARVHGGAWLVRIEDVDRARCVASAGEAILAQLTACGLVPDEEPWWQHRRGAAYAAALDVLRQRGLAYDCGCTRSDIDAALTAAGRGHLRFGERIYPGTCRAGLRGTPARAVRLRLQGRVDWFDRRLGPLSQDLDAEVGDIVLKRADGCWAYQLAVVVDDAAQGITDVVRGEDLASNTARQMALQQALELPRPRYLHSPLVWGRDGHKLSKQNGAEPLDLRDPVQALAAAGRVLGIDVPAASSVAEWLAQALPVWAGIIAACPRETQQGSR